MKRALYIILLVFLFFVMSLPKPFVEKVRYWTVASLFPIFDRFSKSNITKELENSQLKLENRLLREQMNGVYEWLSFEERIQEGVERMKKLSSEKRDDLYWNEFFRRRSEQLRQILEVEQQALPARIIFRDPSVWGSSFWINVGMEDNEILGRLIVAKDSPVVVGSSLVGVVEFVGKKESCVRLITDSGLVPSVRAVRGEMQDLFFSKQLKNLLDLIYSRKELFSTEEEQKSLEKSLLKLKSRLSKRGASYFLAKGELHGSSHPLWRSRGQTLKGIGFNYDFADEEGAKRDLSEAILKEGDLLITTGMDGILPAGLDVAIVSKVHSLKEGSYAYEIEAKPAVSNIDELNVVFVMPPISFDRSQK